MDKEICHDCGIRQGHIHQFGCDVERCPFCGGQLISCDCMSKLLNIQGDTHTSGHEDAFLDLLNEKGRVPYIAYPSICAKCGELWPDLFMVPDEEWENYIQIDMRKEVICRKCYNWIKSVIDSVFERKPT